MGLVDHDVRPVAGRGELIAGRVERLHSGTEVGTVTVDLTGHLDQIVVDGVSAVADAQTSPSECSHPNVETGQPAYGVRSPLVIVWQSARRTRFASETLWRKLTTWVVWRISIGDPPRRALCTTPDWRSAQGPSAIWASVLGVSLIGGRVEGFGRRIRVCGTTRPAPAHRLRGPRPPRVHRR
jgi:hypothetical protein